MLLGLTRQQLLKTSIQGSDLPRRRHFSVHCFIPGPLWKALWKRIRVSSSQPRASWQLHSGYKHCLCQIERNWTSCSEWVLHLRITSSYFIQIIGGICTRAVSKGNQRHCATFSLLGKLTPSYSLHDNSLPTLLTPWLCVMLPCACLPQELEGSPKIDSSFAEACIGHIEGCSQNRFPWDVKYFFLRKA